MAQEWVGVVNSTLTNYARDVEDLVMRHRKLPALLKARSKITFNWDGEKVNWRNRYKRHTMQAVGDGDTLSFPRADLLKQAELDWRGYAMTDSVSEKEKLMNKGRSAIVNRYAETGQMMLDDMEDQFAEEFYIDGNASGNENRFHGIESFMGVNGTTAVTGSVAMDPDDTYANLTTGLGDYGGTWSGAWPKGRGSAEYDFWTPLILDVTSTLAAASGGWSSATATWAARCTEILSFGLIHTAKNKSAKGALDAVFLENEYYRLFADANRSKEQIMVERAKANGLVSLGFTDTINYDGAEVTHEYGTPASTGYGFNVDQMEVRSLYPKLFNVKGPEYDMASMAYRWALLNFGNMKFIPRYFLKIAEYGSSGA